MSYPAKPSDILPEFIDIVIIEPESWSDIEQILMKRPLFTKKISLAFIQTEKISHQASLHLNKFADIFLIESSRGS